MSRNENGDYCNKRREREGGGGREEKRERQREREDIACSPGPRRAMCKEGHIFLTMGNGNNKFYRTFPRTNNDVAL